MEVPRGFVEKRIKNECFIVVTNQASVLSRSKPQVRAGIGDFVCGVTDAAAETDGSGVAARLLTGERCRRNPQQESAFAGGVAELAGASRKGRRPLKRLALALIIMK